MTKEKVLEIAEAYWSETDYSKKYKMFLEICDLYMKWKDRDDKPENLFIFSNIMIMG